MRWKTRGTERVGDGVPPWTRLEHEARYRFAAGHVRAGDVVLDCACGDGAGTAEYLRARPEKVLGFDRDTEAVLEARRSTTGGGASFEVGDACDLPQPDRSIDLYISLETIEHVQDARALLSEAVRVLRPGGRFICSTPNRNVQNPGASLADRPICEFHVREFSPRELLDLLTPHFDTIAFYGQNEVGRLRGSCLRAAARLPSRRLAARLSRAVKLPRLVVDSPERHAVVPARPGHVYDLTVAVCSEPR